MADEFTLLPGLSHLVPGNDAPEEKAGAFWSSRAGRTLQGMAEPVAGGAQLLTHAVGMGSETADTTVNKLHNLYQASRKEAGLTPADWDYFAGAGNMLSPVNLIPGAAIGRTARAGATLGRMAMTGAATGAAYGATEPVVTSPETSYPAEKATQVGGGALAGAIMGPAAHAVGSAIMPPITQEARGLMSEGVKLTPGQMMGGLPKYVEDIAANLPFVGAFVRNAQADAYRTYNVAAAKRALAPLGDEEFSSALNHMRTGYEMAEHVGTVLDDQYKILHGISSIKATPQLEYDLADVVKNAHRELAADQIADFDRIVRNEIQGKIFDNPTQVADGKTIQSITSELGRAQKTLTSSQSMNDQLLGKYVGHIREVINKELIDQNPGVGKALEKVNRGWANFVRFEKAVASKPAEAHEGLFNPNQLSTAVNQSEQSLWNKATNRAMMKDLVVMGKRTLPNSIPNSGTPERTLATALLGGTAVVSPQMAAIAGILPMLYSQQGMRFARAALMHRPGGANAIAEALQRYAPSHGTQGYLAMNRGTEQ
jgi:hypothetical protein